jgi:hypothetical protein
VPLAVTVLVTLLVYWVTESYAELLSEQIHASRLPTRAAASVTGRHLADGPPRCTACGCSR